MNSNQLRKEFLEFFKSKDHKVVASDSLIPANDPSLLFTGAGMNQFKDYFLGLKKEMKRAATSQKCFRTGDVDQVGQTASHLTFFEMLGNFSFGDYFKKEAIAWGWEFMTQRMKIPAEKLWVSVYEKDDEAAGIWANEIKLPRERIVRFGPKDNFWPSNAPADGPNGPCGPCSEIYFDYGRSVPGKSCTEKQCSPACKCGRFVEVWNLVFTQFDRQPDGSLKPLPAPNIDTGMGLERLAAVMQDKMSVFETDLFAPLVEEVERTVCAEPVEAQLTVRQAHRERIRAIADHVRGLTFLICDGVIPSNEGRGYVLRMLLRKAVRAGQNCSAVFSKPTLYKLVALVTKIMGDAYPELAHRRESIAAVIKSEEERFLQMLEEKLPLLEAEIQTKKGSSLDARTAARYYDTHGLAYEEIAEVGKRHSVKLPSKQEFEKALAELQSQSKSGSKFGDIFAKDKLMELLAGKPPTEFLGYGRDLTAQAKVLALVQENRSVQEAKAPAPVEVILDRTPFYGEAGGQMGDTGLLVGPEGKVKVADTQWAGSILVHRGELTEGKIRVGDRLDAGVDAGRRLQTAQNHTATHLLHSALRKVLGEHVMQAGSLVAPDHLRLDFSHGKALTPQQRESVESLANEWVFAALPVSTAQMSIDEAKKSGAMALFGEKYAEKVRVVSIGDVSKELCGGIHLASSSEIGVFRLVEEGSIASGVRRVEALTNKTALGSLETEVVRLKENRERLSKRNKELQEQKSSLELKGAAK